MNDRDGRSFRFLLAAGCAALLGTIAAVSSTCVYVGVRTASTVERNERDPALREAAALEQLGATELPEGYRAVVAFSVPLLTRLTILEHRMPDADPSIRPVTTFAHIQAGPTPTDVERLLDLDEIYMELLRGQGYAIEVKDLLGRGAVESGGVPADYVTRRARILGPDSGPAFDGIVTAVRPRCAPGSTSWVGIRFGPRPWHAPSTVAPTEETSATEAASPGTEAPAAGSDYEPFADREGLRELLRSIPFCPED